MLNFLSHHIIHISKFLVTIERPQKSLYIKISKYFRPQVHNIILINENRIYYQIITTNPKRICILNFFYYIFKYKYINIYIL
jgi:hypothetical protein